MPELQGCWGRSTKSKGLWLLTPIELTETKLSRIHDIFMENGFKGGPDEARRIGLEILVAVQDIDAEADHSLDIAMTDGL